MSTKGFRCIQAAQHLGQEGGGFSQDDEDAICHREPGTYGKGGMQARNQEAIFAASWGWGSSGRGGEKAEGKRYR